MTNYLFSLIEKPTIKSVPNVSGRVGQQVDINCTIESEPDDETDIEWYFGTTLIISGDKYTVVKDGTLNRVRISSLTAEDAGNYTCTANNTLIPASANATISLTVDRKSRDYHVMSLTSGLCSYW